MYSKPNFFSKYWVWSVFIPVYTREVHAFFCLCNVTIGQRLMPAHSPALWTGWHGITGSPIDFWLQGVWTNGNYWWRRSQPSDVHAPHFPSVKIMTTSKLNSRETQFTEVKINSWLWKLLWSAKNPLTLLFFVSCRGVRNSIFWCLYFLFGLSSWATTGPFTHRIEFQGTNLLKS